MELTYSEAVEELQKEFKDCGDFQLGELTVGENRLAAAFFRGMCDRTAVSETVLRPLLARLREGVFDGNFGAVLYGGGLSFPASGKEISQALLRGEVFLAVEAQGGVFFCLAAAYAGVHRAVTQPETDVTLRGPRLGFVEDGDKSMVMLRQFLRTGDLKFVSLYAGEVSRTRITLAYLESRADLSLVEDLKKKISARKPASVMDAGYLELLLQGKKNPLFPLMGSTEKVDKAASKLLAGRVALLVDGSPFVLTAPYVFWEGLQSAEDYLRTPYYATAVRCLRFLALLLAVFLPALFVALGEFHPHLLPEAIRENLGASREGLPFPLFWECFFSLMVFELVREVGVRMPRTVGDAVGLVASIILGDAAVEAGLASTLVIMAVALSAVCAFIVPAFMYATALLRFSFLFLGGFFGLPGICLGVCLLVALLSAEESFAVPYLSPLSPPNPKGMEDLLLTLPKKTLGRREEL